MEGFATLHGHVPAAHRWRHLGSPAVQREATHDVHHGGLGRDVVLLGVALHLQVWMHVRIQ